MTTKDRILKEALTLFAENGYDGTSVEQIAGKVGIKAPSLYKHFKGKEDILNTLIEMSEDRYEKTFGSENHIGKFPENKEEFIKLNLDKISFTVNDPMIVKIRKFLVREQFRSEEFSRITTKHQMGDIQKMYTRIISEMMEKGLFTDDDPSLLAVELTSPVVVWISRADREPECKEEMMVNIEKHIRHFCDTYMN